MSGPTPGPWFRDCATVFALSEDGVNRFSASVQGGWVVTGRQRTAVEELEANARLFEAAPRMLAALQQIHQMGYTDVGDRMMVEAAIAKATQP